MLGRLFAPLGMKVFGGLSLALLVAVAVLGWKLADRNRQIEKLTDTLAVCEAQRDQCRAETQAYVRDGERRAEAAVQALREHEAVSRTLRDQIARIRAARPSGGPDCRTPAEVMEAAGL